MSRRGKKYRAALEQVDRQQRYGLDEAVELVKKASYTKFDGAVELHMKLGIDPRKADQMIRGAVILPHGTGKSATVLVFAKGEKEKEARDAGADYVGGEDLVEKIKGGWLEFDKTIATPDMMGLVGPIGRVLGPRGLMPNPKVGTVTFDVARAVQELKGGKVEYRTEKKGGLIQAPIGRVSFEPIQLKENFIALVDAIIRAKPASAKGSYIKSITLAATMSPGVKVDTNVALGIART